MTVKVVCLPSRLSRMAFRPGGVALENAVATAEARLAQLAPSTLKEIDRLLDGLEAVCGPVSQSPRTAGTEIIRLTGAIISLAGVVELKAMCDVGVSLCALANRIEENGVWVAASLNVHLQALRYLRERPLEPDVEQLLKGLQRL